MSNGRCLTARISESPNPGAECSLSDILERDVPEKYYLSSAQMERLLFKSSEARKARASTTREGIACTQAAQAGGMGGKTGLYAVGFNRKDGITHGLKEAYALNASNFRGLNRNQSQTAVLKTDDASFIDLCAREPQAHRYRPVRDSQLRQNDALLSQGRAVGRIRNRRCAAHQGSHEVRLQTGKHRRYGRPVLRHQQHPQRQGRQGRRPYP